MKITIQNITIQNFKGFRDFQAQFNPSVASVYGDNNILIKSGASIGTFYGYQTTDHVFSTEAEAATAYNGTDYLKY